MIVTGLAIWLESERSTVERLGPMFKPVTVGIQCEHLCIEC